jgi:hypothetical protein
MPLVSDELEGLRAALQERIASDFEVVLARRRTRRSHSRWAAGLVVAAVVATAAAAPSLLSSKGGQSVRTVETGSTAGKSNIRSAQPLGTLIGTLAVYGGSQTKRACGCEPVEGTVRLADGRHAPILLGVGTSGAFSAEVPPGRYTVTAGTHGATHWPMGSCRLLLIANKPGARPTQHRYLTIRPSRATRVAVGCIVI